MALPNMTKAAVQGRKGEDNSVERPAMEKAEMSKVSPLVATPRQARHWAKQYRTEIAAGSSSVLSTFSAVSPDSPNVIAGKQYINVAGSTPWTPSKLECKRTYSILSLY